MKRYIDAERAKRDINILCASNLSYDKKQGLVMAKSIIEAIPTAEVQEVRHGKWVVEKALNGNFLCWCTNCGLGLRVKEKYIDLLNAEFCPWCGAKMDGK